MVGKSFYLITRKWRENTRKRQIRNKLSAFVGNIRGSGRLVESHLAEFLTGRVYQKAEICHEAENQKAEYYTECRNLFFEN
jgi:hypothetical protein